jgi:peptide/nickel transport system substrate-binding protein
VRQAAQHAIDQNALIAAVLSGEGTPSNQIVAGWNWGSDPSVVGYPYDLDKAKALLTEAGYPDGFKTTYTYMTGTQFDMMATAVQGMLDKVGIEVELNRLMRAAYKQIAMDAGHWEGMIFGPGTGRVDAAAPLIEYVADPTFWADSLKPADVVAAIEAAQSARDFATKQAKVREASRLITDKYCMYLMLYNSVGASVLQPYVHDSSFGGIPGATIWYTPATAWLGNEEPVIK